MHGKIITMTAIARDGMSVKSEDAFKKKYDRVAIVGLGLMGASLGLALKKARMAREVAGFARRAATRKMALQRRIVDAAFDRIEMAVQGADLVLLCAPVGVIPVLAEKCSPFLKPGAVMTDVGSSKTRIVAEAENIFSGSNAEFVGSHPIAGSEQHGLEAARADLYSGAVVAVTPTRRTTKRALRIVSRFWQALGAKTVILSPGEHDRMIARTSHLPHVIAALLAFCVGRSGAAQMGVFCGAGFRDATRIAAGDPDLWRDILESNLSFLKEELAAFAGELKKLLAGLKKGAGIKKTLVLGRERRGKLLAARQKRIQ